jgi:Putative Actinobacterial Holin-X, holin superfamily III
MPEERTLGQLVSDASKDVSELIRYEVALAKAEIQADVKRGAVAGGMFGAAGFIVLLALVALLIAGGLALALVMPAWLAFIVEAVILLVIAGILALVGRSQIGKIKPPERSIRSAKETIATVRGKGSTGSTGGATPAS